MITITNMTTQADIIGQIVDLAAENGDISAVWLYGSRSKGTAQQHSDYDIAVAFSNFQLSSVEKYLRPNELALDWSVALKQPESKISVIDISLAPAYLAYNVIETGIVIYSDGTSRVHREQNRIYSQFEYQQIEQKRYA